MSPVFSTGAEIRLATRQDIEPICRLLVESFRGSISFWRSILEYPWMAPQEKPHYGAVLFVNGEACGFNGAMFSDRLVNGRIERFAGGFGWCVRPEYRRFSVGLLNELRDPSYTWTNLSSIESMIPLFLRMGYSYADRYKTVVYPGPGMLLRRHPVRLHQVQDDDVTEEMLGAETYRNYGDHFMCTVQRAVFEANGRTCLVVTKRRYVHKRFRGFPVTELYHSSNREFFARHFDQIMARLIRRDKTIALIAEERLLDFKPKGKDRLPAISLFKSETVPAEKIDPLYSELVLFP